ncbi:MAG: hypothetical protein ABI343_01975 [Burkholderiaceae bacterium]
MSTVESSAPPFIPHSPATENRQAGASAINADRATLTQQYEALRLHLVELHSAVEPDMVAIDSAIDRLAQLQLDIKATQGLIGNNPIED